MTEPTDAELEALLVDKAPILALVGANVRTAVVKAMREAFAKWGTQPSGVVNWAGLSNHHLLQQEPLGAEFEDVLNKHRSELYAEATPQPTQAQAGAVPLTDEQISLLRFATSSLFHLFERRNNKEIPHCQLMDELGQVVEHVIRRTVAAHGIKGGQHGADT